MQTWNQLVNNALLGTEKMPLDTVNLPQIVQNKLTKTNPNDRETYFLQAASLAWVLKKTANENLTVQLPGIGLAPPETQSYGSQTVGAILQKILDSEQSTKALLDLFLEKIIEKQWIIPPQYLVKLLNEGIKQKEETRQKISQVLGERGNWLVNFEANWQYINPPSDDELWQTGNAKQRTGVLSKIRKNNAEKGLEILQQTWDAESARDKKAFLETLKINVSQADEPFLQSVFNDVLKQKDNDKGIKADIKQTVVELLLSIENSTLSEWLWQKIQPYFIKKKKLLSLSGKVDVTLNLPEKTDDFFNVEMMNGHLGFSKTNLNPAEYNDAEYWFYEILKYIPLKKWTAFFEYSAQDTISFWQETKGSVKKKQIYKGIIALALARFQDSENALLFLKNHDDISSECYYLLSQADFEEAVTKHRIFGNEGGTNDLIMSFSKEKWSSKFSNLVLQQLCDTANHYFSQNFMPFIFRFLDNGVLANAAYLKAKENQGWYQQQWEKHFAEPILNMLSIKNQIENL